MRFSLHLFLLRVQLFFYAVTFLASSGTLVWLILQDPVLLVYMGIPVGLAGTIVCFLMCFVHFLDVLSRA